MLRVLCADCMEIRKDNIMASKRMKPVASMTPAMERGIEYMIAYPNCSIKEVSEQVGVHYMTAYNWYKSPLYMEEYRKRVSERWSDAISAAQLKLIEKIGEGDWNSIKYILDSAGYNATQKVDVNTNKITITIDNENE